MPEGPEYLIDRDVLRSHILGYKVTKINYHDKFERNKGKMDTDFIDSKLPFTIDKIEARAKRLIMVFLDKDDNDFAIVFFYAIFGYLSLVERDHTQITFHLEETKTGKKKQLHYWDRMNWGFVKLVRSDADLDAIFGHLGPDLALGEISLEMF